MLKTLDTITEEDENNRESMVEPLKQNTLAQSQVIQKSQPIVTKVPAFLNPAAKPQEQMRRQSTLDSMNDALKSRLLAMQSNGKKKVVKKKGRNSDSDDNESSDDDSDESN